MQGSLPRCFSFRSPLARRYIADWAPGGHQHRRLLFALHRLKSAGIKIDMLCWHQGEADANHTGMSAAAYSRYFRPMLHEVREAGVDAPVYVALATLCEEAPHPFQNRAEIRRGQKQVISIADQVLPGPDTDLIGIEHRRDGCHFAASGQELAAQAWFKAITSGRLRTPDGLGKISSRIYVRRQQPEGARHVCDKRRMMTLLKRAFLRTLEQQGYLLLKKAEYAHVPEAVPTSSFERVVVEDSIVSYRIRHQICIADSGIGARAPRFTNRNCNERLPASAG